jgi:hypothetical protein
VGREHVRGASGPRASVAQRAEPEARLASMTADEQRTVLDVLDVRLTITG